MVPVFEQEQYKTERNKILRDMRDYHKAQNNDYRKLVSEFVTDLTAAIQSIQSDPCRYPDYPAPVKKKLLSKGTSQCVILFLPVPTSHMNNNLLVEKVYLTSVMLTTSGVYNEYLMKQLPSFDLE